MAVFTSNSGSTVIVANEITGGMGFRVSTNSGQSFAALVNQYTDPTTNYSYYGLMTAGSRAVYVATDSQNHYDALNSYFTTNGIGIYSAISSGNKLIATSNDSIYYFEDDVLKTKTTIGLFGKMRIKKIDGAIYVLGEYIYKSTDFGKTFVMIEDGPYRATSIWKSGSKLYANSEFDDLKESSDNGVTWVTSTRNMTTESF